MSFEEKPTARAGAGKRRGAVAAIGVVSVLATLVLAPAAGAAFPGTNGPITFTSDRDGGDFDIFTMTAAGASLTDLTDPPPADGILGGDFDDETPEFSASGDRVVFTSARAQGQFAGREIWVMDANGANPTRLTTTATTVDDVSPAFSPNGNRIVFASDRRGGQHDLYTMASNGTNVERITRTSGIEGEPVWSPDGRRIAYSFNRSGGIGDLDIYSIRPNGADVTRLTSNPALDGAPDYSPNGRRIAFSSGRRGDPDIFSMRANGKHEDPVKVLSGGTENTPSYSPDGTQIVFHGDDGNDFEIFTIAADGSGVPTQVTNANSLDIDPDWGVQ